MCKDLGGDRKLQNLFQFLATKQSKLLICQIVKLAQSSIEDADLSGSVSEVNAVERGEF